MSDSTAHCLRVDVSVAGSNYYVRILSTIDRELLKPSASVALHKHSNALVDVLPPEADSSISMLQAGVSHGGVLLHIYEVGVISSRNWQS
jgi:ATP-dependent 26S proteasome regulatory subunit